MNKMVEYFLDKLTDSLTLFAGVDSVAKGL